MNISESLLRDRIAADDDRYTEVQFSKDIYLHVASHPDGEGAFELYAIVPHDVVDPSIIGRGSDSVLPMEVPSARDLYDHVDQLVADVTGKDMNVTFYLQEVVDDGVWQRDATMYCTHKLTAN